jgi:starvation-inducible DNA-binding protein
MNKIGLDISKSQALAERLNGLLADYTVFYQNTRGLHWNIKGEKFFELHLKFEELYNDLILKIDEIAERILTLGGTPLHTFESYLLTAEIKSAANVSEGTAAIQLVLDSFKTILIKQRELLNLAADAEDEGTTALMSDYIRMQEKLVWMYSAYIAKN